VNFLSELIGRLAATFFFYEITQIVNRKAITFYYLNALNNVPFQHPATKNNSPPHAMSASTLLMKS